MKVNSNFIWLDLEMTGLDPEHDRILEIATVVTDKNLNVLEEGPVLVVHQRAHIIEKMDEWNTKQHGKSGLIEKVQLSKLTEAEVEAQTIDFISKYVPEKKSPMCGNSIGQDRRFLCKYMPKLEQYFHYRNLDVSTLKILAKSWYPEIAKGFKKKSQHVALADVYDSINELKYYKEHILKPE